MIIKNGLKYLLNVVSQYAGCSLLFYNNILLDD